MNKRILELLMTDGKLTYNDVAVKLRRSASTIRDRIRRLEDDRVILGYVAVVDSEAVGMRVEGILLANMANGCTVEKLKELNNVPTVTEVLQVSGRRRIMVRLLAADNRTLHDTIQTQVVPIGLVDVELHIVLDSVMRFPGI